MVMMMMLMMAQTKEEIMKALDLIMSVRIIMMMAMKNNIKMPIGDGH